MDWIRAFFLAALLCLVTVNARHHAERLSDAEDVTNTRDEDVPDQQRRLREDSPMRHRRKRWQSNFGGYDYRQPSIPFYENDRRDYIQPDINAQILRLLDEIASYVKRPPPPPPPPQPIYIPYPIPYPVQNCECRSKSDTNSSAVPQLPNRFPEMDDTNQNWGIDTSKDDSENGVYNRPVNFTPILPDQQFMTTSSPPKDRPARSGPGRCAAAVLSCCRPTDSQQKQYQCFVNLGCKSRYSNSSCSKDSINAVIESFSKAYSPL